MPWCASCPAPPTSPTSRSISTRTRRRVSLSPDEDKDLVALAFKLEDGRYGQLTYVRVYQGRLAKGDTINNARTGKRHKVGRLVRMHAAEMEEIEASASGDIVAMFGIDCASGDTFCGGDHRLAMSSMHVPEPVISLAIAPKDNKAQVNMSKALGRFTKEDPTFRTHVDPESGETIIQGMGELHLDVYVERMKREYGAEVTVGQPQVAYRETITKQSEFDYLHKKQTGGSGQYGRVAGYMEPMEDGRLRIRRQDRRRRDPPRIHPLLRQGLPGLSEEGLPHRRPGHQHPLPHQLRRLPRGGLLRPRLPAGGHRRLPFRIRQGFPADHGARDEGGGGDALRVPGLRAGHAEPAARNDRGHQRGRRLLSIVEAEVPLAEMFGYSTVLRSSTQGKAEFTMEFARYRPVPRSISEELIKKYQDEQKKRSAA